MHARQTFFSVPVSVRLIAATVITIAGSSALAAEDLRDLDIDIGSSAASPAEHHVAEVPTAGTDTAPGFEIDLESSTALPAEHHLPDGLTAGTDTTTAAATTWSGYDSATHNPVVNGIAEARLLPRLRLLAGFGSNWQPGPTQVRPLGGAQLEILRQAANGINVVVGFMYRKDRFTNEEGLLEWSATLSRRFGRALALVNLAYSQDGEGDDHDGEVHAVGIYRLSARLEVGGDARVLTTLGSSDPYRVQRADPTLDFACAPLLAYSLGRYSVMAEAGWTGQKTDCLHTGALVLGGLGAVY